MKERVYYMKKSESDNKSTRTTIFLCNFCKQKYTCFFQMIDVTIKYNLEKWSCLTYYRYSNDKILLLT